MANTVQAYRGTKAALPTLAAGQFGFCTDTKEVYVGDGATNHLLVGATELDDVILLANEPGTDDTGAGHGISATVDANATGVGAALHLAADGHYEEADASAATTVPCTALALEAGTGTKKVLLSGVLRNDGWAWTTGPGTAGLIYLSTTTGALTQTAPSGDGDMIQVVGYAITDDVMMFNPQLHWIEHA